jgi:hypothetical protein
VIDRLGTTQSRRADTDVSIVPCLVRRRANLDTTGPRRPSAPVCGRCRPEGAFVLDRRQGYDEGFAPSDLKAMIWRERGWFIEQMRRLGPAS